MKLLVTGGAGFIGSTTADILTKAGHDVVILDDFSTGHRHNVEDQTIVEGDFGDSELIKKQCEEHKFDAVLHFAAKIRVDESMEDPVLYYSNNTFKALQLIDTVVRADVKNFIFSSTAAVYGEPETIPVSESEPANPINPYGRSKLMTEMLLKSYEQTHGLNWVALRYFNAAGAHGRIGPDYPFLSHLIPSVINALQTNKDFQIYGTDYDTPDGTCVRDFVHVDDIAEAHVYACEKMADGLKIQRPINLGSATGFSVRQVVEMVEKVSGKKVPIKESPRRPGDYGKIEADASLAHELLGWKTKKSLEDIVRDGYEWQIKHKTFK